MELAALTTPVVRPWTSRRKVSCSAEVTNAIRKMTAAPPNRARSTISLRPCRSASAPQMGDAIIMATACTLKTADTQKMTEPEPRTPRNST